MIWGYHYIWKHPFILLLIIIYLELEPKWGPVFWLEFRPCFGKLTFKNRCHWGLQVYIYVFIFYDHDVFKHIQKRLQRTIQYHTKVGLIPSKIEWDLTNGPLSKLLELLDTQDKGSVQWVLLGIS